MKIKITKIIISAILFTISSISLSAQFNELDRIQKSTTLVILENDSTTDLSRTLRHAVTKFWTLSKVQFITDTIYKTTYINNPDYTFIGSVTFGSENYYGSLDGYNMTAKKLSVFSFEKNDDKNKKGKYYRRILVDSPTSGFDLMYNTSIYGKNTSHAEDLNDKGKIIFVVHYLQAFIEKPLKLPFYGDGYGPEANKIIHKKTLVISQESLAKNAMTIEEIKNVYPYEVKIVSKEDLNKYIDSKDPSIVFAIFGGGNNASQSTCRFIIDAATGEILMNVYDPKGAKFSLKDFKNITKK